MENNNLHIGYENIQSLSMNFDAILQEIAEFNKSYGLIQKTSKSVKQSVNTIVDEHEYGDEFDEEREFRVERILHFADEIGEYGLKISTYKGEEFYESNILKSKGYKIGLEIYDEDLFIEFIQTQSPEANKRIFTFFFNVIIDSLKMSDFYGKNHANEEKNKHISDVLDIVQKCGEIHSPQMNFLIEDYKNLSLYQSLLSKFSITHFSEYLYVTSVKKLDNFENIENAIIDGFGAIDTIGKTQSRKNHHLQHQRLLAEFMQDSLNHIYTIIFKEITHDKEINSRDPQHHIFKNAAHMLFVNNFFREYEKREKIISDIIK